MLDLQLWSEVGGLASLSTTSLTGTLASSTASATATIPSGFSRFWLLARWTP